VTTHSAHLDQQVAFKGRAHIKYQNQQLPFKIHQYRQLQPTFIKHHQALSDETDSFLLPKTSTPHFGSATVPRTAALFFFAA